MPVTLRHPPDHPTRTATYGVDPQRGGLYLDLVCDGATVPWDAAELVEDHDDPIHGVLAVLSMYGYVLGQDVDEALAWIDGGISHDENSFAGPPQAGPSGADLGAG